MARGACGSGARLTGRTWVPARAATIAFAAVVAVGAAASVTGCGDAANGAESRNGSAQVPLVRDSVLSMDTMIARFQASLPRVESLGEDAPTSVDELIARFGAAVEDSSVEALDAITVSEAEFAYLYFPTSIFAAPPYAQPPAVNWLLMDQNSRKGQSRLLRAYGGRRLDIEGYRCEREQIEGANRTHDLCVLLIRRDDAVEEERLFGGILERDGRYKLISLANRL